MAAGIVGIDLGGTKMLLVRGDETFRVATGPGFSPADLEASLRDFVATFDIEPTGIGIAVPGLVADSDRIVACDVLPNMTGWSARAVLAGFDCPVVVVNDVKAALAEEFHDADPGTTAGIVMVGTAVGAAFLADGKPLLGASGWAGELGYLPISMNGAVKRLDDLAGGAFMAARCGVDGAELAELARRGDATALAVVRDGGFALGLGLAAVVNLLNPSRLGVGGGAVALPGYWDAALDAAAKHSIPEMWNACRMYRVRDDGQLAARGAARCVRNTR